MQKKPFLNLKIFELLVSGNTQRRIAKLLSCSRTTVDRKLLWLSTYTPSQNYLPSAHIQIDEMESIEHTKLKPVTIPLCVDQNYQILAVEVGKIPAKGHLSQIALKKYGFREDQRESALRAMLSRLKESLKTPPITITTDSSPIYPKLIKEYFPKSEHIQILSRAKVAKDREHVYSAERKRIFDPMFALNQRCAKLRADVRRLTRRSWCTTKKVENLKKHLELYRIYNNQNITAV